MGSLVACGCGLIVQKTIPSMLGLSHHCQEQNVMVYGLKRKEVVMVKLRREEVLTALRGNLWMGIWWRLVLSPASPNEHLKLELLGAWEPDDRSCSSQLGEGSRAQSFVFDGDKTRW